jgi:predicted nuclease with TOPRIM domain
MKIEVSNGEIVDKLTIIQIKLERIADEEKLVNLRKEYAVLDEAVSKILSKEDELYKRLYDVNCKLWDIEDRCREYERNKDFGAGFVETTRSVYITNDMRSEIKKEINLKTGSDLIEEKSYDEY